MPKVVFLPHPELCPDGAALDAESGESVLDVALRNTDISILDRMSLLLLCCNDCIGAVSVKPVNEEEINNV